MDLSDSLTRALLRKRGVQVSPNMRYIEKLPVGEPQDSDVPQEWIDSRQICSMDNEEIGQGKQENKND